MAESIHAHFPFSLHGPEKLFGVIGYPIRHSLSPLMHNTAFQHLGLPYL
ncbi:MAG: shikimate dehydrogenase, partial [Nitrospinota bacterium]